MGEDGGSAPSNMLSFSNIRGQGKSDVGQFRISTEQLGWKNKRTNQVLQYRSSDIRKAEWLKAGKECQLKLHLKGDNIARFDGFKDQEYDQLAKHFSLHFRQQLDKRKISTKGWHWGEWKLDGKQFSFLVDGKAALEVGTNDISQVVTPSKTDISIEFHQDENAEAEDVQLLEVRFFVPPKVGAADDGSDPVTYLKEELVSKADIGGTGAEAIALLPDVNLLVPRGRYEIDMFKTALKLHGKTFDYSILYKSISRLFLLPKPDQIHVSLIVSLDAPMRQGQTRYPFVVMQFENDKEIELELNGSSEELEKAGLQKSIQGKTYDVVTRLFKALVNKPVVIPGDFRANDQSQAIRCSTKAQDGLLYPLNKSFIFIHKPVIFIRFDDVLSVEFSRTVSSTTRYFEIKVSCRGGVEHDFSSIDRNEYQPLVNFLQSKNIKIKNLAETAGARVAAGPKEGVFGNGDLPSDDEEDDEDFEEGDEEEDDDDFGSDEDEDEDDEGDDDDDEEDERPKKKHKGEKKEKKHKSDKGDKKSKKDKKKKDRKDDD